MVLTMLAIVYLGNTEIHPAVWIISIFVLFLVFQYLGLYKPKIFCSECKSSLYEEVEAEYKRTKKQEFLACPICGAKFNEPRQIS